MSRKKKSTSGLATGLAAAALVASPALLKLGGGSRVAASVGGAREATEACIETATDVSRRPDGADAGVKLAKGTHVETLSDRGDWVHISYSVGGRGHVGWVPADSIGDCSRPVVTHGTKDADESNEPPEEEDGDWSTFNGCPLSGNAKQPLALSLNPMKNRFEAPKSVNSKITLDEILAPGDDTNRWNMQDGATIEGWIIYVKKGGIETCNCKSKDPQFMDTHIGIAASPTETRENHQMIIEVTPRMRAIMQERGEDWSTPTLASTLVGKHVRITGWMLFDGEHANMAENTTPNHAGNWRATAWEIHPVTSIEMLSH